MTKLFFILTLFTSFYSQAGATCSGKPEAVYAGVHGGSLNESTFWVSIPNVGLMPLGRVGDDAAKARFSLAQTALVTNKTLTIKYYHLATCADATQNKATPTQTGMAQ